MLIKTKISLAVIASMMASSVMATQLEDPDVLYPLSSTVYDVSQPKIAFKYIPSATGYLIDLVKLEDFTSGTPVVPAPDGADDNKCGEVVATKFVTASDADLACGVTSLPDGTIPETTACEWLAPTNLEDGMYGVVVSSLDLTTNITVPSRSHVNCAGKDVPSTNTSANNYTSFEVDTSSAPEEPVATAIPARVSITPFPSGKCIDADLGNNCIITFTHANVPMATWYRVEIRDKNHIMVNPRVVSDTGNMTTPWEDDDKGWLKISDASVDFDTAVDAANMNLTCTTTLAGLRTCKVKMGSSHGSRVLMPILGGPYKVWIKAWNAKGTAGWSFPEEFTTN